MIYTIGRETSYLSAILASGTIDKIGKCSVEEQRERWHPNAWMDEDYPGGVVFKTFRDAEAAIKLSDRNSIFAVFGVDADWEDDTEEDPSLPHFAHRLLVDSRIIVLC
jgi:hypothetical protein